MFGNIYNTTWFGTPQSEGFGSEYYNLGNMLYNGDFLNSANPAIDWNVQAGWVIQLNNANVNHGATTAITQNLPDVLINETYEIRGTVFNYTQGTLQTQFGGQVISSVSGNEDFKHTVVAAASAPTLYLYAISTPQFSVRNLTVRKVVS
ncbi:MAG: hypothetical protein Unbinned5607contig1000_38 [Prokaryotic dsDNA virus sp.]|nr:MAG: hypothetical protein Unbinned5607contig1000_38 [Prokaryotic dsDNA virus sp.]|tara:strand:+ start:16829 stop:17275 length:447 start_codon:yes stop_codon:yes gene_type:complete